MLYTTTLRVSFFWGISKRPKAIICHKTHAKVRKRMQVEDESLPFNPQGSRSNAMAASPTTGGVQLVTFIGHSPEARSCVDPSCEYEVIAIKNRGELKAHAV